MNSYSKKFTSIVKFLYQDKKVINELKTALGYLDEDKFDFESIDILIHEIRDNYSSKKEDRESDMWIYNTYEIDTENYIFEVSGSNYIKTFRIYEEQLDDYIYVIDKNLKRIEDQKIELKLNTKNKSTWLDFFENKSLDELKAELLKYKFPKKN